jgi:hypothetical protein
MPENKNEENKGIDFDEIRKMMLDEYSRPKRFGSKFWLLIGLIIVFIVMAILFKFYIVDRSITEEELKSSIELFDIDSQWVVKNRVDTEEFKGVIVVPQISFRVRNIGPENLKNVFFLGVFAFLDTGKVIGEGYRMFLQEGLDPRRESRRITLTSALGYRASSEEAFNKNPKDWRSTYVEIFVRSRNSKLTFLKSFYIKRKIEGQAIDVRI